MSARTRDSHTARTRTGDLAPWSRPRVREVHVPERLLAQRAAGGRSTPVFVDETGRRHRAARIVAGGLGAAVVTYVVVIALTFAGVPFVGRLTPPGVERLARPVPRASEVMVGPGAQESPLPPPAAASSDASGDSTTGTDTPGSTDTGSAVSTTAGSGTTTSSAPGTTTTTMRGNGPPTSQPTSSSTVPDRTHPTGGGPPETPPGQT